MSFFKKIFVLAVCLFAGVAVVFGALLLSGAVIATAIGAGLFIVSCLIGAAVLIIGAVLYKRLLLKKYKSLPLDLPEAFTITAHTGCCETPMNSLESIVAGAEYGAQVVEFDLNFNADGTAVLSHNIPTGSEVTLDEAFRKVAEYPLLRVNVDVKNTSDLSQVKALAEKHGILDRIFYTGIFERDVNTVKNQTPKIPYYLNTDASKNNSNRYLSSLINRVKDSGAIGINLDKKGASKKLINAFHKNGLLVSAWTVDSEYEFWRIASMSPDNITTKKPDKFFDIFYRAR